MLKTYILPKYYKSSTSDEHLIGRQHCNSEVMLITHRVFQINPKKWIWRDKQQEGCVLCDKVVWLVIFRGNVACRFYCHMLSDDF